MGIHFDNLVESVKRLDGGASFFEYLSGGSVRERNLYKYLENIIARTALFEIPLNSEEIFPRLGKEKQDYDAYLKDYLDLSSKYGKFILTPFPITAFEDRDSVVILDGGREHCKVIEAFEAKENGGPAGSLFIGDMIFHDFNDGQFRSSFSVLYSAKRFDNSLMPIFIDPEFRESINSSMAKSAESYFEQAAYVMDPENFIISGESNASKKQTEREGLKGKKILRKTIIRPHYQCLSEKELIDFFREKSCEPRAAHPVRGHWRKLMSDKFINKQGQRIFIQQYFTGQGEIKSREGMTYQVMIKESPTQITPYNQFI